MRHLGGGAGWWKSPSPDLARASVGKLAEATLQQVACPIGSVWRYLSFMPRPIRILFENAWYHVINRGAARKLIFHNDEQRAALLKIKFEKFFPPKKDPKIHAFGFLSVF